MRLHFRYLRVTVLSLGLVAVLGAGTFVMAQTGAPPAAPTPQQRLFAERQAIRDAERMARLEGRIAFLRTRLQITPAQTALWNTFAQALRDQQTDRNQAPPPPPNALAGPPPVPERLARRRADLTARGERLTAVANALTPLYGTLSVEQKAIADRSIRLSDDGRINIARGRNRGF